MKHLANYISIMPLSHFESFNGTILSGSSEPDLILAQNDLQLKEQPQSTSPGTIFNQSMSITTIEKLSDAIRKKYANHRPVIALVYDETGTASLWGSDDERLRVTISPGTDRDVIELDRKSVTPIY
jgi:hypothetical protein